MLSVTMNDLAAQALGLLSGRPGAPLTEPLVEGLQDWIDGGVALRGDVLVWTGTDSRSVPDRSQFPDLTGWEACASSFHLDGPIAIAQPMSDDEDLAPDAEDQLRLLRQGFALALEVARLVRGLRAPPPVRCLVSVSDFHGTFRFHVIRDGESWHDPDLDTYAEGMLLVVDVEPPARIGRRV